MNQLDRALNIANAIHVKLIQQYIIYCLNIQIQTYINECILVYAPKLICKYTHIH